MFDLQIKINMCDVNTKQLPFCFCMAGSSECKMRSAVIGSEGWI